MIVYRLFLILDLLLMLLSKGARKKIFTALASLAHLLAGKRNRIIRQNLTFAFRESLSESEQQNIEKYCYRNLALNLLQVMENRRNKREDLASQVTFENREPVDAILAQGRGIIFVSAHFGNWELGGAALSALITPVTSIYKGFSRSEFDPYLFEARARHRMELAEKNGALKHIAKGLKNNRSVLLMIDQASNARYGVTTDFFGHPTYHSSTAAQLSAKFQVPIVGVYISSEDEEHYTIRFEEPIELTGGDEASILEATRSQVEGLEKKIRENPKLWFWCHKRWKGEFPALYR